MVITKFEKVIIPQTLEGRKFADEYMRKFYEEEQRTFISRMEDLLSITIKSRYFEEVEVMTNQEAIKIGEDIITNMRNHSWSEFENQDFEAIEKLIQTAKEYDVLTGIIGICGEG